MNRLQHEPSPYLRLHAGNPVDWWPWGEEAFTRARELQRPIFLSIGYFTCHWCHVMERESFAEASVAEVLNRDFISIKVDREERPDVDRIYMSYVQATTGSGGWPLSVFLTPQLQPFYGGTYFPPVNHARLPSFTRVLASVAEAWRNDRARLLESSEGVQRELGRMLAPAEAENAPAQALMNEVWPALFGRYRENFDSVHGGFGGTPKFPHPVALEFLLRFARHQGRSERGAEARAMLAQTLGAMAQGGLQDVLAGGFHRYTVDEGWRVPHFEKMLYDQAQLALVYLGAWQLLGDEAWAAVARSTLNVVLGEMAAGEGGFFAAQDADSPLPEDPSRQGEGAYYLWTWGELEGALPDAKAALAHFQVRHEGNVPAQLDPHGEFEGKNILYGGRAGVAPATLDKLYARRRQRPRPATDDKILTSWNGLMISALARGGAVLDEPDYVIAAQRAAESLRRDRWDGQRLLRTPSVRGFADDYAFLIQACLDLQQADFDPLWLALARELQRAQEDKFAAPGGGYYATEAGGELILRLQDDNDGAEPATTSVALANLLRLDLHYPSEGWRERGDQVIASATQRLRHAPEALPLLTANLELAATQARRITVAGPEGLPATQALLRAARRSYQPHATVVRVTDATAAAGFVCEDERCQLPISDPETFLASLQT